QDRGLNVRIKKRRPRERGLPGNYQDFIASDDAGRAGARLVAAAGTTAARATAAVSATTVTAAARATATTATAVTTAATAIFAGTSFVNGQRAAVVLLIVQRADRGLRFSVGA